MKIANVLFITPLLIFGVIACEAPDPANNPDLSTSVSTTTVTPSAQPGSDPITLRITPTEGQAWSQDIQLSVTSEFGLAMLNESMIRTSERTRTSQIRVENVTASGEFTMIDSRGPEAILKEIQDGENITDEMEPKGPEVVTYVYNSLGETLSSSRDGGDRSEAGNAITEQMSEIFKQIGTVFPEEPVSVGDRWIHRTEYPGADNFVIENTCEFLRLDKMMGHQVAVIGYQGGFFLQDPLVFDTPDGPLTIENLDSSFSGEAHFAMDLSINLMKRSQYTLDMRLTAPGGPDGPSQLPLHLVQTVDITRTTTAY